jgi:Fe2+ or Zn2+ uptake regulation protein
MKLQMISDGRRTGYAARRLADFEARCREGGLAVTPQRLAIVRTLETLCEIGEAHKVTTLHDSARYDGNVTPHHHVVCVRCRRVRDIEVPELEQLLAGRESIGEFQVLGTSLEVRAICARCNHNGATRRSKRASSH